LRLKQKQKTKTRKRNHDGAGRARGSWELVPGSADVAMYGRQTTGCAHWTRARRENISDDLVRTLDWGCIGLLVDGWERTSSLSRLVQRSTLVAGSELSVAVYRWFDTLGWIAVQR
jgi:hypothetical protein